MSRLIPMGLRVLVSGSGQSLPVVPWIAILNPRQTRTAQEGLYVVYLFRSDLSKLYLSMNQGTTQHYHNAIDRGLKGAKARAAALTELRNESALLRQRLSSSAFAGLSTEIALAAPDHFLPRGYEAGNIGAIEYDLSELPDEAMLRADLTRMRALYDSCIEAKEELAASSPRSLNTPARASNIDIAFVPKAPIFRPRNADAYIVEVQAQMQKRDRQHEVLLTAFAGWMRRSGFVPANNVHPRDLTVDGRGKHWLVEAKTVSANAEDAVREAIGQLFSYRHFYYRRRGVADPILVALFSEAVGEALAELLTSLGIEAIWYDAGQWEGRAPEAANSLLKAVADATASREAS